MSTEAQTVPRKMSDKTTAYYAALLAKNELTRSDVSIYPSYSELTVPYRVVCRQRYHKAGIQQRRQFMKEISVQEALQTFALDGVRVHREFCDPVLKPPVPEEIIEHTREEIRKLEKILAWTY